MHLSIRISISLLIVIWIAGIFIAWIIPYSENLLFFHPLLSKAYSLVCHQEKNKLIVQNGNESLVCSRCVGIYLGFFSASVISLLYKTVRSPSFKIFLAAASPMLLDVFFYTIGLYTYSKPIALFTGLLLGSVGFLYFYSGLNEFINEQKAKVL